MDMKEKDNQNRCGSDYRIVALYSKEKQSESADKNRIMLSYYDKMEVKAANDENPSLRSAYTYAAEWIANTDWTKEAAAEYIAEFPQVLITFTEYVGMLTAEPHQYTKKKIDSFWDDDKYALLFLTMIHIGSAYKLSQLFRKAQEHFCKNCLVYLSFDQSDIIVFSKANSFREYAELVFRFDYGEMYRVTDSITLCSFTNTKALDEKEHFEAYFRLGTRNYSESVKFVKNLDVKSYCSLGRNDMTIVNPNANVKWLYETRNRFCNQDWCTTYDLCVMLPLIKDESLDYWTTAAIDTSKQVQIVREALLQRLEDFKDTYKDRCKKIDVQEDTVWLRWMHDTVLQASSFLKNRMSRSIALCLIPQIRDMLTYAMELYGSKKLTISYEQDVKKSLESIHSNSLILLDSMNHSNRQFVQTPSFHVPAFEMPSKIMAYYTAIVQYLIKTLKDDTPENPSPFYGFTIAPRFTNTLSVYSIAIQDIIPKDEFISIAVDERSLHDLRLTTEMLAHEMSHYVGWKCRCREERAKQLVLYKIVSTIEILAKQLQEEVFKGSIPVDPVQIKESARAVYDVYCLYNEKRTGEKAPNLYLKDLHNELRTLLESVSNDRKLCGSFYEEILKNLVPDEKQTQYEEKIIEYIKAVDGICIGSHQEQDKKIWEQEPLAEAELKRILDKELSLISQEEDELDYSVYVTGKCSTVDKFNSDVSITGKYLTEEWRWCSLFRETFADLQMIMLFELDWDAYCDVMNLENVDYDSDVRLRMIAVGRVLRSKKYLNWDSDRKPDNKEAGKVWALVRSDNLFDETSKNDFVNPMLCEHLEVYLEKCYEEIKKAIKEKETDIERLRDIHDKLSSESVVSVQESVVNTINEYMEYMIENCKKFKMERINAHREIPLFE